MAITFKRSEVSVRPVVIDPEVTVISKWVGATNNRQYMDRSPLEPLLIMIPKKNYIVDMLKSNHDLDNLLRRKYSKLSIICSLKFNLISTQMKQSRGSIYKNSNKAYKNVKKKQGRHDEKAKVLDQIPYGNLSRTRPCAPGKVTFRLSRWHSVCQSDTPSVKVTAAKASARARRDTTSQLPNEIRPGEAEACCVHWLLCD